MGLREFFRLPPPDEKVSQWHVAPVVDTCAYGFSWIWVLIPLLIFAGSDPKPKGGELDVAYVALYVLILAAVDVHRHYTIPLIYLDKQIRKQFPARFLFFPVVLLGVWSVSPLIATTRGVYLSIATVTAIMACALVVIQIIRRDGSVVSVGRRESIGLLIPFGVAGLITRFGDGLGVDPAWWWVAAALCCVTYLDLLNLKRAPATPASDGASLEAEAKPPKPFIYSIVIAGLVAATLYIGPQIEASLARGGLSPKQLINLVAVVAFTWNLWHFYMQKYGFMRLYNAKSAATTKVPGFVDRLLIFCWLPLYFSYLVPQYRDLAMRKLSKGREVIGPLADKMDETAVYLTPITVALVVSAIALWLFWEWKSNRMENKPRLMMAGGTSIMGLAFLAVDPMKAYLAFAFSHSLEYMVFVWAYQRKRYAKPLQHDPLLGRILRHPLAAYGIFILCIAAAFVYMKYYGRYIFPSEERPRFLGHRTSTWIAYWGIYQSMAHFYWDGFMWKIRHKSVRKHI